MNYLFLNAPYASRMTMRRRIVSLLVLLAVFFGSTVAPALAHAGDGFAHATEVVDVHEDEAPVASSDHKNQSDTKESGNSSSVAFHHHCTCATKTDDSPPEIAVALSTLIFPKTQVAAMPSRRSAPLTEPPSA